MGANHISWLHAAQLFDGENLLKDMAIGARDGRIVDIMPMAGLPNSASAKYCDKIIAPSFFDIQINGGGDVLFNNSPNVDGLSRIAAAHAASGTLHWLPTVITDAPKVMQAAVEAVINTKGQFGIAGIHIEGPHISATKRGTHQAQWIRPFDNQTLACITRLRQAGIAVLLTIAPEAMQAGQVAMLVQMGVVVAIGHSNASAAQTQQILDEGATLFTHLFNAMSPIQNREPNVLGTAINSSRYCSMIVDGVHVDLSLIGMATRARPVADRMILITDAMPTVGGGNKFQLYGKVIRLKDGRLINDEGSLAGAHTTILAELANMVHTVGVPLQDALKMASSNPACLMKLDAEIGRIGKNTLDKLLFIAPDLSTLEVKSISS